MCAWRLCLCVCALRDLSQDGNFVGSHGRISSLQRDECTLSCDIRWEPATLRLDVLSPFSILQYRSREYNLITIQLCALENHGEHLKGLSHFLNGNVDLHTQPTQQLQTRHSEHQSVSITAPISFNDRMGLTSSTHQILPWGVQRESISCTAPPHPSRAMASQNGVCSKLPPSKLKSC